MPWRTDERTRKIFGAYSMVSQTHGGASAHLVTLPDGRCLRLLPDDQHSGQARSRALRTLLEDCAALNGHSDDLKERYLTGGLSDYVWEWADLAEEARAAVAIEEWLDAWFDETVGDVLPEAATQLLRALHEDGWKVTR